MRQGSNPHEPKQGHKDSTGRPWQESLELPRALQPGHLRKQGAHKDIQEKDLRHSHVYHDIQTPTHIHTTHTLQRLLFLLPHHGLSYPLLLPLFLSSFQGCFPSARGAGIILGHSE